MKSKKKTAQANKKVSHTKRNNQLKTKLSKQGKLNKRRNHKKTYVAKSSGAPAHHVENPDPDDQNLDIDSSDLKFLKNAVADKSYKFLSYNLSPAISAVSKRKRKKDVEVNRLEEKYEQLSHEPSIKRQKFLLPFKSADGLITRSEDVDDSDDDSTPSPVKQQSSSNDRRVVMAMKEFSTTTEVCTSELIASRHQALQSKKFRIGLLCSGLLESPEGKIGHFKSLFEMLEEKDPLTCITVKKLTLVSLMEVFKDLLPNYQIRHNEDANVKLKKDVKQLHEYEIKLLKAYKTFLQKIEKLISILRKKKGDTRVFKESELKLAQLALECLCDLLRDHSYFNFSKNIIHLIVPYLNSNKEDARESVSKCIRSIFKSDTRGEISLEIVRSINKLVKSKNFNVHPTSLQVFLQLKLKDVNLDSEKEDKLKEKRLKSKKHNVLRLSKRERKREKRLKELNQELLETKAEESKSSKLHHLTEITKLMFALYFKVVKVAPSSKLLNVALEGIAKFAHCISIDFYHDLINVLHHLIENENLGHREQMRCVQTVFAILSYQGATINVDPIRFYTHFYANLFNIDGGKTHVDLPMALSAAESVIIKRRKHLSLQRLLAFTKRLSTLSLQVLPNGSLGLITLMRQVIQLSKACGILLDTDSSFGKGVYQPELEEPEYCNAGATALWELVPLQRHYHPTVRQLARYVATLGANSSLVKPSSVSFLNKGACELFTEYDSSEVKFVPPVPPPKTIVKTKHFQSGGISNIYLRDYVNNVLSL